MTLVYNPGDELPAWTGTIRTSDDTGNMVLPDLSSGWTFTVVMSKTGQDDITKTTGITGAASGKFTVGWVVDELDIAPLTWRLKLIAKRASDQREFTVRDRLFIDPR